MGVWAVKNDTATNTSGGSPGDVLFSDWNVSNLSSVETFELARREFGDLLDYYGTPDIDEATTLKIRNRLVAIQKELVDNYMKNPMFKNVDGIFNTQPAQVQYARDNHMGITFSNAMELTPKLRLSVMANYRRETLDSTNVYQLWDKYNLSAFKTYSSESGDPSIYNYCIGSDIHGACRVSNDARSGNRKGKRNEFNAGFKFEYTPTD